MGKAIAQCAAKINALEPAIMAGCAPAAAGRAAMTLRCRLPISYRNNDAVSFATPADAFIKFARTNPRSRADFDYAFFFSEHEVQPPRDSPSHVQNNAAFIYIYHIDFANSVNRSNLPLTSKI